MAQNQPKQPSAWILETPLESKGPAPPIAILSIDKVIGGKPQRFLGFVEGDFNFFSSINFITILHHHLGEYVLLFSNHIKQVIKDFHWPPRIFNGFLLRSSSSFERKPWRDMPWVTGRSTPVAPRETPLEGTKIPRTSHWNGGRISVFKWPEGWRN